MAPPPGSTAFVLIPGGFFPGSVFDKVTSRLEKLGYAVTAIDNPSALPVPIPLPAGHQPPGFYDDAELARQTMEAYMNEGKNVVVVGNSYGGCVAMEGVKGLSKQERQATGKSGGRLANLVLLASLPCPVGKTVTELISGNVDVNHTSDKPYLDAPPAEIAIGTMTEASPDEAMRYGAQLRPQSTVSMHQPLTHDGYMHVPSTIVITEKDQTLPVALQHELADDAISRAGGTIRKVQIPTDHVAMVSSPDVVVGVLLEAASA